MAIDLKAIGGFVMPQGPGRMPAEPWRPSILEIKVLSSNARLENKLSVIMEANRERVWIEGGISDIKLGRHLAGYVKKIYPYKGDIDNFDAMTVERDDYDEITHVGWSRGLNCNVSMMVGRTNVLVMDDHLFAAPFIIEKCKEGVIRPMSSMAHIDDHRDLGGVSSRFDIEEYLSIPTDHGKIVYLYKKTRNSDWLCGPLFNNHIISPEQKDWRWLCMNEEGTRWIEMPLNAARDVIPGRALVTFPDIMGSSVVDIDIDCLTPVYRKLSMREKRDFAQGKVPHLFKKALDDLADIAVVPKVTTIATSPGFFNQPVAIVCAKELLARMQRRVR